MSWNCWPGALGSFRASTSASRATVDISAKFMLLYVLACTNVTLLVGEISSTNMHSCGLWIFMHGLPATPVPAVRFGQSGCEPSQVHAAQVPEPAGGVSPYEQYSLAPSVPSSPSFQLKWIAVSLPARSVCAVHGGPPSG